MEIVHVKDTGSEFYNFSTDLLDYSGKPVFCDIETTGLEFRNPNELILSLQVLVGNKVYIFDFTALKEKEHLVYVVNRLQQSGCISVFFNAKFDLKFILNHTGILLRKVFDTMTAEVLLNAGIGSNFYSLKELALRYLGIELDKEIRTLFTESGFKFTEETLKYAADDVIILKPIYEQQLKRAEEANEQRVLELEMNLIPVVAKMEFDGTLLDKDAWIRLYHSELQREAPLREKILAYLADEILKRKNFASALEVADALAIPVKTKKDKNLLSMLTDQASIKSYILRNLNIASNKQLKTTLNFIGIPAESVSQETLKDFSNVSPVINYLVERSESQKRISTYGEEFFKYVNRFTGRIHTEYLNIGAVTGRFSSTNPNMQNIPTAPGYRESFIATPGWKWISCDYSQQEYRLAGSISGEDAIINAYIRGADMHTATASILFNKPFDQITKSERSRGKSVNFAILYGSTEYGLKYNLGISLEEARDIIRRFNEGYPKLYGFKKAVEDAIVKFGYSSTPLGRRRYNEEKPAFMDAREYSKYMAKIKREGFNHIIQGGGADIIKIAMVNIFNKNPFGDKFRLLLQVHDEIDAEATEDIAEEAAEFMKQEMLEAERLFLGELPAEVDVKIGDYWVH